MAPWTQRHHRRCIAKDSMLQQMLCYQIRSDIALHHRNIRNSPPSTSPDNYTLNTQIVSQNYRKWFTVHWLIYCHRLSQDSLYIVGSSFQETNKNEDCSIAWRTKGQPSVMQIITWVIVCGEIDVHRRQTGQDDGTMEQSWLAAVMDVTRITGLSQWLKLRRLTSNWKCRDEPVIEVTALNQ